MGAKPKPKPKPSPKTKPHVGERDINMAAFDVQDQCQMDYARLCSSRSSYGIPKPRDSFMVDVWVADDKHMHAPQPCAMGAKKSDDDDVFYNDGDDDYPNDDDDDSDDGEDDDDNDDNFETNIFVYNNPLLDIVQDMFSSLRLTTPIRPELEIRTPRNAADPAYGLTPRALWLVEPEPEPDYGVGLGFGSDGDMCLLDNIDHLSPTCQASINNLQNMIDNLDVDDDEGCPMMPFILLFLLLTLFLRCIARRRMLKRQDSLHTTLAAIHASPELKAKVEAASGIPVPPTLPACRAGRAMAQQPWYVKALCVVGFLGVSFLVVVTAMLITGAIVNSIYDNDSDDDNASPIVVLAILFSVLTLELLIVKRLRMALCSYLNSSPNVTASSGTSLDESGENGGGIRSTLPEIFQRMRSVQISSLLPNRTRSFSSSSSGPQYEPLLSEEERDNTDVMMVQVPASAPPASATNMRITTIPVVVSPIDAPSNVQGSISML